MTCGHCEQAVEGALEDLAGVTVATADRETEQVTVEGEADPDATGSIAIPTVRTGWRYASVRWLRPPGCGHTREARHRQVDPAKQLGVDRHNHSRQRH